MPQKRKRSTTAKKNDLPSAKRSALQNLLQATTVARAGEGNPPARPVSVAEPVPKPVTPPRATKKRAPRKYRFQAQTLFCTFPQCDTTKEVALENLLASWKENVLWCCVAEEKHENEDPHLHAVVKFKSQVDYEDAHFADFIVGKHGSYEACRSLNKALEYVQKDGNFVTYGELPKRFTAKKPDGMLLSAVKMIESGCSMEQVRKAYPVAYLIHRAKFLEYERAVRSAVAAEVLPSFPGFVVPTITEDYYGHQVATWINKNFMEPRTHKQPQLWLCGASNIGKTYIVEQLQKYFMIYRPCGTSKFYDGFSEEIHDAMCFDEYKGHKTITELNGLLEGVTVNLEVKGAIIQKTSKNGNMPIIILSNYTPQEAYHNATDQALDPLLNRLLVVHVTDSPYRFNLAIQADREDSGRDAGQDVQHETSSEGLRDPPPIESDEGTTESSDLSPRPLDILPVQTGRQSNRSLDLPILGLESPIPTPAEYYGRTYGVEDSSNDSDSEQFTIPISRSKTPSPEYRPSGGSPNPFRRRPVLSPIVRSGTIHRSDKSPIRRMGEGDSRRESPPSASVTLPVAKQRCKRCNLDQCLCYMMYNTGYAK